jgi:Lrp/AsnC family leucine-responsive transcriptional regulator
MSQIPALDRVDRKILAALQRNGRMPNSELAAAVGLSESACLRRVRGLETSGVIERYTAVISARHLGFTSSFLIRITLKAQTDRELNAFENAVNAVPEVAECHLLTGEADYVLRVVARDSADFERLHSKVLTKLPNVARVDSSLVLRTVTRAGGLPIA